MVELQGVSSDPEGVVVGFSHESILGPLLFILHASDLPDATVQCNVLSGGTSLVLN